MTFNRTPTVILAFLVIYFIQARIASSEEPTSLVTAAEARWPRDACQGVPAGALSDRALKILFASKEFAGAKHGFPPDVKFAFVNEMGVFIVIGGRCFVEMPIYIDSRERMSMWKTFAVGEDGAVIIKNADGEYE